MKKINNFDTPPKRSTCVALGYFDGIHKGHLKVLNEMTNKARTEKLIPLVFTFEDNIKGIFSNENIPNIILKKQKEEILSALGVEYLYSVYSSTVINLTPESFVFDVLYRKLRAKHVFCGFNFYFGKNKTGNTNLLQSLCKRFEISVHVIPPIYENEVLISSSAIRQYIKNGDIEASNNMLGRKFSYTLPIIKGEQIGKKLNFPTINQNFPSEFIIPKLGVYKSFVKVEGDYYQSITNIGVCPTVKEKAIPHSETFIINYPFKNLYNKNVTVYINKFLREEKKFKSFNELKHNILNDIKLCNYALKNTRDGTCEGARFQKP